MTTLGKIFLVISAIANVILFALLIYLRDISSDAVVALFGVFVGSLIAGLVQFVTSDANIRQQFRLAALDKRLQAHQEAYALWQQLMFPDRKMVDYFKLILDCIEWWNNNCLYLSADARAAFRKAYNAAEYLSLPRSVQAGPEARTKDMEDLKRAGEIIVRGVYLPSIGEEESKRPEKHPDESK